MYVCMYIYVCIHFQEKKKLLEKIVFVHQTDQDLRAECLLFSVFKN